MNERLIFISCFKCLVIQINYDAPYAIQARKRKCVFFINLKKSCEKTLFHKGDKDNIDRLKQILVHIYLYLKNSVSALF